MRIREWVGGMEAVREHNYEQLRLLCEQHEQMLRLEQANARAAVDTVNISLHKAFSLGQKYWYEADSESARQNRMAKETLAQFDALIIETLATLRPCCLSKPPEDKS